MNFISHFTDRPTLSTETDKKVTETKNTETNKKTSIVANLFFLAKEASKGAFIWMPFFLFLNRANLGSIFSSELNMDTVGKLKETLEKEIVHYRNSGYTIPESINPKLLLSTECPMGEYSKQLGLILSEEITKTKMFQVNFFNTIFGGAIAEEVIFRYGLQEFILKDCVKKIVKLIAPNHISLVDSTIYTVCRILITSICFSASHLPNYSQLADNHVVEQLYGSFVMGVVSGVIKETIGIKASIGAHAINNFIGLISPLFKC